VQLAARGAVTINLPRGSNPQLKAVLRYDGPLRAPFAAGTEVAVLEVSGPGVATAHIPLFTTEAVGEAGPLDRIINAIAGVFS
jgi:D-alanyl-D-alanine carboxypeptidase (penicillin-binding protein 5/6)